MKYIIIIAIYVSLGFASSNPNWFRTMNEEQNQIIGYGEAELTSKATEIAKGQIASRISSKVDKKTVINKGTNNDGYYKTTEHSLKVSSNIKLKDLRTVKSENINGKWYIAVAYDWTEFSIKFKKRLINYKLRDQNQNNFLTNTTLVKNLNTVINKKLNYKLYNKNNVWNIAYKDVAFNLNDDDLANLFAYKNSNIIDLELNEDIYEYGSSLSLNITSNKNGYVSIFYVGKDGQVGLIGNNLKINKSLIYPKDDVLTIKNNSDEEKKFMIAVLYSAKKIDLRDFDKVSTKEIKNASFVKLLKYFEKYEYLTAVSKASAK